MVKVRDMVVGKFYRVNGKTRKLTTKTEVGSADQVVKNQPIN